jgi:hypothetical protein
MKVFEELKDDDCRWPLAEFDRGEFLFCGDAIAERYIAPSVPSRNWRRRKSGGRSLLRSLRLLDAAAFA